MPSFLCNAGYVIRRSQAKGLIHTSPAQRPGFPCDFILLQAIGLRHRVLWVRLAQVPTRRRDQSSIPQDHESRFQRSEWSLADEPRALPWAGMNDAVGVWAGMSDAVGVPNRPAVPRGLFSWCLSATKACLSFRTALGFSPEGTAEIAGPFSRPFGTYSSGRPNPTLKRWAIVRCPSGTGIP